MLDRVRGRWRITFFFGLIHGFGFASILREMHLPREGLIASLLAFNLGVEAGQLVVVLVTYPLVVAIERQPASPPLRRSRVRLPYWSWPSGGSANVRSDERNGLTAPMARATCQGGEVRWCGHERRRAGGCSRTRPRPTSNGCCGAPESRGWRVSTRSGWVRSRARSWRRRSCSRRTPCRSEASPTRSSCRHRRAKPRRRPFARPRSASASRVVEPEEIDRVNIYQAGLQAMHRAVAALPLAPEHLIVDARHIPNLDVPQTRYVRADAIVYSVAAASIIAKVHRDALDARPRRRLSRVWFRTSRRLCHARASAGARHVRTDAAPSPFVRALRAAAARSVG